LAWLQLITHTNADEAELIAERLETSGASSVTCMQGNDDGKEGDHCVYEPDLGETPMWADTQVTGLFDTDMDLKILVGQLKGDFPNAVQWEVSPLEDKDWTREWMRYFEPMRFGRRLWICPSWQPAPEADAVNIMLDPGLAFGTGTHPTTSLCLEWLDHYDLARLSVIDYGCGSGILGIAALKLGAKKVTLIDNDPQALEATWDNAKKNQVEDRIEVLSNDEAFDQPADVVLANILANPLIELAPKLAQLTRPQGCIVLSGILGDQSNRLMDAYQSNFKMEPITIKKQWVRMTGVRLD
jgi:ribosomal protein L11 methyltransferase